MAKSLSKSSRDSMSGKFISAAKSKSQRVHVVSSKGEWAVKRDGAKRASSIKGTLDEAIRAARNLNEIEDIVIHKKDGSVLKKIAAKK